MIHQFPQGTLYDLNAFCAWQDPALLLGGFTGTELTLIGLSAWAWVARSDSGIPVTIARIWLAVSAVGTPVPAPLARPTTVAAA